MRRNEHFSIRQMVELTGLSEFTIRGWENRYAAFNPARSDTGRREYSKMDVERALLLRELLKRGHKIGKIAALSGQRLQGLFSTDAAASAAMDAPSDSVHQVMELVALQKWERLTQTIREFLAKSPSAMIREFFLPILSALSDQVAGGIVTVAQEHIVSSLLKEKAHALISTLSKRKSFKKGRFVLATPEGDYHEIGLLLAHALIRAHGFTSLYMGPHTPAADLAETALRFDASHLLIVSTLSKKGGARQEPLSYISEVKRHLGTKVEILVAGSQAPARTSDVHSRLHILDNFHALEELLIGGIP